MTVSITHAKVSGKPAGSDPNRVYGTHWDENHVVPVATNAEAQAGSSDDVLMTPAKTLAAINANITTSGEALTRTNDTNITLTLGGTPTTAVLRATSLTLGWAGTLAASRGGFGADISAQSGVPLFTAGAATFTSTTGSGNFVRATSPTLVTPALGTPASGTLTSCTGLPISGVSGLGTGIATFLGTPSSANLASAITDETGTGSLVFASAPTLTNPVVGTQTAGDNSTKAASTAYVDAAVSTGVLANQGAQKASFRAHKNGTNQSISLITNTKVTCTTEVFDQGSYYDATNSKWTPPAGPILAHCVVYATGTFSSGDHVSAIIYKNGVEFARFIARSPGGSELQASIFVFDVANGSGYYECYTYITGSGSPAVFGAAGYTYFEGTWIG